MWATRSLIRDDLHDAPDHHYYLGAAYAAARQLGWKILDRHGLTKRLHEFSKEMGISPGSVMTDRMHYYPFLNDEMNNLLLSMVCQHL